MPRQTTKKAAPEEPPATKAKTSKTAKNNPDDEAPATRASPRKTKAAAEQVPAKLATKQKAAGKRKKADSPAPDTPPSPPAPKKATRKNGPKADDAAGNNEEPPPDPVPPAHEADAPAPAKRVKKGLLTVDDFLPKASADLVLTCGNGDAGQLGLGSEATVVKRPKPIKSFPPGTKFLQVVAGGMHTVVLTSKFEVFTAGCNDEGALGRKCLDDDEEDVDEDQDYTFRKVDFPEDAGDIVMISAGDSHTAALTRHGSVFVWGTFRDKGGRLGVAMGMPKMGRHELKERQVVEKIEKPFLLSPSKDRPKVVKIASGSDHILMLTEDGKIFSSGAGDAGQLGRLNPHARDRMMGLRAVEDMMTPAPIKCSKRNVSFVDLWCATYCSFARAKDGKIYVWGLNNYRQLGWAPSNPEQMDLHYPQVSEQFESTKNWTSVAGCHHVLAVDSDGNCYGIGRGDDARLGQGDNIANSDKLVRILADNVAGVAASTGNSFMWTKEGSAFAWGLNIEAELGLGVEENTVVGTPQQIEIRSAPGARIVAISANAQHVVFLANNAPVDAH